MTEKISITIEDITDPQAVIKSLELLFQKIFLYYLDNDAQGLMILLLTMGAYFGRLLTLIGFTGEQNADQTE